MISTQAPFTVLWPVGLHDGTRALTRHCALYSINTELKPCFAFRRLESISEAQHVTAVTNCLGAPFAISTSPASRLQASSIESTKTNSIHPPTSQPSQLFHICRQHPDNIPVQPTIAVAPSRSLQNVRLGRRGPPRLDCLLQGADQQGHR